MHTLTNQHGLTLGQCASLACVLEATAPKPGNVHRGADFEDLTYPDLILSGIAIAREIERAPERPLGQTILAAVLATRRVVSTNTNLGITLLLAPLAAAATKPLPDGVRRVLDALSAEDARLVYVAIRLAKPGGLGKVETADVAGEPPESLVVAMRLAAERDLVARQYANGFAEVFGDVVPALREAANRYPTLDAIVYAYLTVLAKHPDSLIARKCGPDTAHRASQQAAQILASAKPGDAEWHERLADFDFWLRSDGHRRNPGTTADLITAGLFVTLWEGSVHLPFAKLDP
ncbi:MAG: triphosphoribosyl-dephospho-CoA synthase [Pirellulales bacterium]